MKDDGVRLDPVTFSRRLIETGDVDPLYIALYHSGMDQRKLCKWLVAYACFYNAGLCCWIVEQGAGFWNTMKRVTQGGTAYPRGTERRHFRGEMAIKAVRKLAEDFPDPVSLISWLEQGGPTAKGIMQRVKQLYGFGEWISWKVPDICERLGVMKAQFCDDDVSLMFSSSKKGAQQIHDQCNPRRITGEPIADAHFYLLMSLKGLKAPPLYDRPINVQETETCFCKYHAHTDGYYPIGKDTVEILEGLEKYGQGTKTAHQMSQVLSNIGKYTNGKKAGS